MNPHVVPSEQSALDAWEKSMQAAQQLQHDKQRDPQGYIHLYVDDIEGDWLENWTWEDDLTDYIEAFEHNCRQQKYGMAFEVLDAIFERLKRPNNQEKGIKLFKELTGLLESFLCSQASEDFESLLIEAKARLSDLIAILGKNGLEKSDLLEEDVMATSAQGGTRLETITTILNKVHNGIVRRTWKYEYFEDYDHRDGIFERKGVAIHVDGKAKVEFGVYGDSSPINGGYFVNRYLHGSPVEEIVHESHTSLTASSDEYHLIEDFLGKVEQAKWKTLSSEMGALPE
jgi:hypothetical protein